MNVAFVGVGTMGGPMARQLLSAGHTVYVADRSSSAIQQSQAAGAVPAVSPAAAADGKEIVFLSLPGPPEVADAVLGLGGVLSADVRPRLVVDLSTNGVDSTRELRRMCDAADVGFVDAPVSGGVAKAEAGTLSVMVGATEAEFALVEPLLTAIGEQVVHVGPPGAGTVAKLVNNQVFLAGAVLIQEAFVLAAAYGLGPDVMRPILDAGSAATYARLAPLLLGRAFDDVIFRLDIAAKDLELAVDSAKAAGAPMPVTEAAATLYRRAVTEGFGEQVFHATLRMLEREAGVELPPVAT